MSSFWPWHRQPLPWLTFPIMELGALPGLQLMGLRKCTEPKAMWTWAFWRPFPQLTWSFRLLGSSDQHLQPLCLLWQWALSDEQVQPWPEAEDDPSAVLSLHSSSLDSGWEISLVLTSLCFRDTKSTCWGTQCDGGQCWPLTCLASPSLLGSGCGWEWWNLFLRLPFCSHYFRWACFASISFSTAW